MRCSNEMLPLCLWHPEPGGKLSTPKLQSQVTFSSVPGQRPLSAGWFWAVQHQFLSAGESTLLAVLKQEPSALIWLVVGGAVPTELYVSVVWGWIREAGPQGAARRVWVFLAHNSRKCCHTINGRWNSGKTQSARPLCHQANRIYMCSLYSVFSSFQTVIIKLQSSRKVVHQARQSNYPNHCFWKLILTVIVFRLELPNLIISAQILLNFCHKLFKKTSGFIVSSVNFTLVRVEKSLKLWKPE